MRIGERLGFGMALALVVVAQQIVTVGMTPVSDQRLWLDKFVAWSFYWVLFGVVQSVLIGFLFYIREDRQARKEHRRLSMMNTRERKAMMRRAEARRAVAAHDEEEVHPLTTTQNNHVVGMDEERDGATELSSETMESRGGGGERNISSSSEDDNEDSAVKGVSQNCLYTFPLRKMDFFSLFFAAITYSVFIVVMVSTASSGAWLNNEPRWFDETSTARIQTPYDNDDPNS